MFRSVVFSIAVLLGVVCAGTTASAGQSLPPQPKAHPAGIPANALLLSPCVATMGEHWAALKDWPLGPIYGTYRDKPVFTEIMVSQKQMQRGFSYDNIRALPGYHIDHVNVEFEPHGHPGFPVPHYDIHAYYVSAEQESRICPGGAPDEALKARP
jgi:hypothetical protein